MIAGIDVREALCSLGLIFFAYVSHAAESPDGGAIRKQIEEAYKAELPQRSLAAPAKPKPAGPVSDVTVVISKFQFEGNTLIGDEELAQSVAGFVRRELKYPELEQAVTAAAGAYRKKNRIAHAYLPPQEIKDGVVLIQIVEGVFGSARIEGAEPRRIRSKRALAMIEASQIRGTPIDSARLDRAVLLVDDLPGVSAAGTLAAGEKPKETDLILKLLDEPLLSGSVRVDNGGARTTGYGRFIGTVNANSFLTAGERVSGMTLASDGTIYGRLAVKFPAGNDGWQWGANGSYLVYQIVAGEFENDDAEGTSSSFGLEVNYPWIRSRQKNLFLGASYDRKYFYNEINRAASSRYTIDSSALIASGNLFDTWGGGGSNVANLSAVYGFANLDDSPNEATDLATTNVHGGFFVMRFLLSREQLLNDRMSVYLAYSGQVAAHNLDSSEKFYLGGMNGVRAYPANEGGGATAQLLTVEWRMRGPFELRIAPFYDFGQVIINRDNDFPTGELPNRYELEGAGLSLERSFLCGLTVKGAWARRVGHNPNPDNSGRDQDGSLHHNRFWIQADYPF